jgi:CheY-like chemotaxis protein
MPHLAPRSAWRGDARAEFGRARSTVRIWNINVLLVEDDDADTALVLNALRRNPNVGSARASSAPDAVLFDLANDRLRPDLILLDIHMPKLNGFRFLEALRRIPAMRQTPVVFLSTSGNANDVKEAQSSTMSLYVVKPDTYQELEVRLGHIVERAIAGEWGR